MLRWNVYEKVRYRDNFKVGCVKYFIGECVGGILGWNLKNVRIECMGEMLRWHVWNARLGCVGGMLWNSKRNVNGKCDGDIRRYV